DREAPAAAREVPAAAPTPRASDIGTPTQPVAPMPVPTPTPTATTTATAASAAPGSRVPRAAAPPSGPDPVTRLVRWVHRWFTEGNVPVKVGMLVLFAGVAALLKYATDQGWMRF